MAPIKPKIRTIFAGRSNGQCKFYRYVGTKSVMKHSETEQRIKKIHQKRYIMVLNDAREWSTVPAAHYNEAHQRPDGTYPVDPSSVDLRATPNPQPDNSGSTSITQEEVPQDNQEDDSDVTTWASWCSSSTDDAGITRVRSYGDWVRRSDKMVRVQVEQSAKDAAKVAKNKARAQAKQAARDAARVAKEEATSKVIQWLEDYNAANEM